MKRRELRQILDEIAAQAVPSHRDVWPMLRERLTIHPTRRVRLLPANRLGWLGFVLGILFIFSITAYATGPWFSSLFVKDERLQNIDLNLIQPLNLNQTIDNVTITVEWAYADPDVVLVGYTLRSSDGRRFDSYHEALQEIAGVILPWQGTYGLTGRSDTLQITLPASEGKYVAIFDNTLASRVLDVQFKVRAREFVSSSPLDDRSAVNTSETEVVLAPVPVGRVIGPFTFDFEIPVVAGNKSR